MQNEFLVAVFTGLAAMLGWGFADFFAKKTIDAVGDIVSLVWAHIFGTAVIALFALYQVFIAGKPLSFPSSPHVWILLAGFGTLQAIVYLLTYKGFGKGQVAVLNPVFASYSGLVAVISIVLFGERLNNFLILALVIIFVGVLLISLDLKGLASKRINLAHTPGLKEVGIASLLAAIWTISWDKFVGGNDWVVFALFMYGSMTIAAFIISRVMKVNLTIKKPDSWKFLFLIGLCETIAYLAISLGFSTTSYLSIIAVLSGAFSLPTMLLARVFLKEKVTTIQTIGSIIIVLGIIILALR